MMGIYLDPAEAEAEEGKKEGSVPIQNDKTKRIGQGGANEQERALTIETVKANSSFHSLFITKMYHRSRSYGRSKPE